MTLSQMGLRFIPVNDPSANIPLKLEELNRLGLKFVAAIRMRDKTTERDFVVAMFEMVESEGNGINSKR